MQSQRPENSQQPFNVVLYQKELKDFNNNCVTQFFQRIISFISDGFFKKESRMEGLKNLFKRYNENKANLTPDQQKTFKATLLNLHVQVGELPGENEKTLTEQAGLAAERARLDSQSQQEVPPAVAPAGIDPERVGVLNPAVEPEQEAQESDHLKFLLEGLNDAHKQQRPQESVVGPAAAPEDEAPADESVIPQQEAVLQEAVLKEQALVIKKTKGPTIKEITRSFSLFMNFLLNRSSSVISKPLDGARGSQPGQMVSCISRESLKATSNEMAQALGLASQPKTPSSVTIEVIEDDVQVTPEKAPEDRLIELKGLVIDETSALQPASKLWSQLAGSKTHKTDPELLKKFSEGQIELTFEQASEAYRDIEAGRIQWTQFAERMNLAPSQYEGVKNALLSSLLGVITNTIGKSIENDERKAINAATMIQKHFRGHQVRSTLTSKLLRLAATRRNEALRMNAPAPAALSFSEVLQAAPLASAPELLSKFLGSESKLSFEDAFEAYRDVSQSSDQWTRFVSRQKMTPSQTQSVRASLLNSLLEIINTRNCENLNEQVKNPMDEQPPFEFKGKFEVGVTPKPTKKKRHSSVMKSAVIETAAPPAQASEEAISKAQLAQLAIEALSNPEAAEAYVNTQEFLEFKAEHPEEAKVVEKYLGISNIQNTAEPKVAVAKNRSFPVIRFVTCSALLFGITTAVMKIKHDLNGQQGETCSIYSPAAMIPTWEGTVSTMNSCAKVFGDVIQKIPALPVPTLEETASAIHNCSAVVTEVLQNIWAMPVPGFTKIVNPLFNNTLPIIDEFNPQCFIGDNSTNY